MNSKPIRLLPQPNEIPDDASKEWTKMAFTNTSCLIEYEFTEYILSGW